MTQLAIKGTVTSGEEVIEILEMLGGENYSEYNGKSGMMCYYIDKNGHIECDKDEEIHFPVHIFTLDEFEEKFPYKIGDRVRVADYESEVRINSMSWDGHEIQYQVFTDDYEWYSAEELNKYNEINKKETMEKGIIYDEVGTNRHGYTTMMLNPYKEELIKLPILTPTLDLATEEILYFTDKTTNKKYYPNEPSDLSMECPDGFEFIDENGNVITSKKIKLERKKKQLPKTYEECCEVLGHVTIDEVRGYKDLLLDNLQMLLICRDAYWKIAGDWKYDVNKTEEYFYIVNKCGRVVKEHYMNFNHILAFPTEEMRDAFYENFKELIEECKELL